MSLGSVGRTLTLGHLIYQADVLDGTAYSAARLSVAAGSDPSLVVNDTNGYVRQIELRQSLVDIPTLTSGFQVAVYPMAQVGGFDTNTGLFPVSGSPSLVWTIENPDATPVGRVLFTKTQGTSNEVHEAQWQGTNGVAGTMTITRYGGKWKEVREYYLAATNTQRIETISQYKQDVLQHKTREVYQQFYNWGNPGDVFEAIVQRIEDPDGKALTTTFQYWDQTSQPGNELYQATYPDGYSERIPNRFSGNGFAPVVASGGELRREQPFQDYDPGSAQGRVIATSYTNLSSQLLRETTETSVAGQTVGYRQTDHDFSEDGIWKMKTYDVADDSGLYTYEELWQELSTRRPVFTLDRTGKTYPCY